MWILHKKVTIKTVKYGKHQFELHVPVVGLQCLP